MVRSPIGWKINMKLSLFEERTVTSQEEMINITKGANIERYCKTGYSKIRLAVPGEKVTTIVNGQEETTNTAKEGDCVIEGPEKELYIVSNGDYLMSNPTGKIDEVYRVAKIVFDKMWSVQKKDVEDVD